MKTVEMLVNELNLYANEYREGKITRETMNNHLTTTQGEIDALQLNYEKQPLKFLKINNQNVMSVFESLLKQHKRKAAVLLHQMKHTRNMKQFEKCLQIATEEKMYFQRLHDKVKRNCWAYNEKNRLHFSGDFEVFVLEDAKGVKEDE